jgi:hypothetical protein
MHLMLGWSYSTSMTMFHPPKYLSSLNELSFLSWTLPKQFTPMIDYLDSLYSTLIVEQVNLPDFIKAMVLLTALPSAWKAPIIQTIMQGSTITTITFNSTKQTILQYWDAEKAKNVGKTSFTANKISVIKHRPNDPSFASQKGKVPYKGDNLQQKNRKNQRGKHGGRDKSGQ